MSTERTTCPSTIARNPNRLCPRKTAPGRTRYCASAGCADASEERAAHETRCSGRPGILSSLPEMTRVPPFRRRQVEVQRGDVRHQKAQGRQGRQRGDHLDVTATALTDTGPPFRPLALGVDEPQLF